MTTDEPTTMLVFLEWRPMLVFQLHDPSIAPRNYIAFPVHVCASVCILLYLVTLYKAMARNLPPFLQCVLSGDLAALDSQWHPTLIDCVDQV
jgi:hypothetical protein